MTARKAGWGSDWPWCNAWWKCTGERWRLPASWGKAASSSCVCRLYRNHSRRRPPSPTETDQPSGPSLRVMVVDDNVDTVATLAMLVQESGHDVRTAYRWLGSAGSGPRLPTTCRAAGHRLAGTQWFRGSEAIRQQPALQNVVLVAMTGYGQEGDRQRSHEAGFDHHLVKPGDFGKLLQIMATISESPA